MRNAYNSIPEDQTPEVVYADLDVTYAQTQYGSLAADRLTSYKKV